MSYTKLFGSIVNSSIWFEPNPTRIVWITMLAMANRDGVVEASTPGLAARAIVTLGECEAALEALSAPDKYSKNPANEGRRIERVKEGWRLLNYDDYRNRMSDEDTKEKARIRKQRQRAVQRLSDPECHTASMVGSVTVTPCPECHDIERRGKAEEKQIRSREEVRGQTLMEVLVPSKPQKENSIPDCLETIEGFTAEWEHFREHRKKKVKMTPHAEHLLLKKLAQKPSQAIHAVQTAIERGWTGFEWEWLEKNGHNGSNGRQATLPAGDTRNARFGFKKSTDPTKRPEVWIHGQPRKD